MYFVECVCAVCCVLKLLSMCVCSANAAIRIVSLFFNKQTIFKLVLMGLCVVTRTKTPKSTKWTTHYRRFVFYCLLNWRTVCVEHSTRLYRALNNRTLCLHFGREETADYIYLVQKRLLHTIKLPIIIFETILRPHFRLKLEKKYVLYLQIKRES